MSTLLHQSMHNPIPNLNPSSVLSSEHKPVCQTNEVNEQMLASGTLLSLSRQEPTQRQPVFPHLSAEECQPVTSFDPLRSMSPDLSMNRSLVNVERQYHPLQDSERFFNLRMHGTPAFPSMPTSLDDSFLMGQSTLDRMRRDIAELRMLDELIARKRATYAAHLETTNALLHQDLFHSPMQYSQPERIVPSLSHSGPNDIFCGPAGSKRNNFEARQFTSSLQDNQVPNKRRKTKVPTHATEKSVPKKEKTLKTTDKRRKINQIKPTSIVAAARKCDAEHRLSGRKPMLLYMKDDEEYLSEYQCFLRQNIEIFEATEEDLQWNAQKTNRTIVLGQVGLRCKHCAMQASWTRPMGSVYFTSSLDGLYQAGQNMSKNHFFVNCTAMPAGSKQRMAELKMGRRRAGGGKHYWSDSARVNGVYEDDFGLKFKPSSKSKL